MDHRTFVAGQRIKALADRQGVSIGQLSEATRIGVGMIRGIVTGVREPNLSHMLLIADALAVDLSDIIGVGATHPERMAS